VQDREVRRALAVIALALVAAPLGWWASDRVEENDAFCTACHLPSGAPLHAENARDYAARPAVSLAVAHAVAGSAAREDGAFRCIDCHGGTGLAGRARVKLLSLRDAAIYLAGRFDEPHGMTWPLRDEDCRGCHAEFASEGAASESWEAAPFHSLAVHNRELGVNCVECHVAHERGGLADRNFLHPEPVRAQCARCHAEFEGETSS
jgi:nitrate/TMAO reductase-like tetraheme cytochrome c subunit